MPSAFMCFAHIFIHSVNLMTSSFNLNCSSSLTKAGINCDSKFKESALGSRDCCFKCCKK